MGKFEFQEYVRGAPDCERLRMQFLYAAAHEAAFIENGGQGYALNALWKVYHDTESARALCGRIDQARADAANEIVKVF
ncbi:MAG: DUF3793 family protein [Clostridiales Family XIII bacterium]|nr:DUF3793 family protein [Clostridiales Family XIII bacterium]